MLRETRIRREASDADGTPDPVAIAARLQVGLHVVEAVLARCDGHDIDRRVGAAMRRRRLAAGLTQAALAARIGVTHQQLQKLESGLNQLTATRLSQIAAALGVGVGALFESEPDAGEGRAMAAACAALLRDYRAIADETVRDQVRRLVAAIARDEVNRGNQTGDES